MFDIADLPQPTGTFEWVQAAPGPALVCRPLARYARHLYTTRYWPLGRDSQSWADVAASVGLTNAHLLRVRQVHGAAVLVARDDNVPGTIEADIIIANRGNERALAVQAADCVPLLFADRGTGAIAVAHAGWRGLAARVPQAAIAAMMKEFGTESSDIIAAAGPSIGACCYEVGVEVRVRFEQAGFGAGSMTRWFHRAPVRSATNPPLHGLAAAGREGHWFFDAWSSARDQLIEAGVDPRHVFVAELCTASHPAALCSYRRDGAQAGRMAGVISSWTPHRSQR